MKEIFADVSYCNFLFGFFGTEQQVVNIRKNLISMISKNRMGKFSICLLICHFSHLPLAQTLRLKHVRNKKHNKSVN